MGTRHRGRLQWMPMVGIVAGVAAAVSLAAHLPRAAARVQPLTPEEQEVRAAVRALWQQEDDAAATGDAAKLDGVFDLSSAQGRDALKHARSRLAFVQAWARARGVVWGAPVVSVRTPRIRFGGGSPPATVDVTAIVSEAWTYEYSDLQPAQTFGLGREHFIELVRTAAGWRIGHDWFTDPLDQDTRIPGPAVPEGTAGPEGTEAGASAAAPTAGGAGDAAGGAGAAAAGVVAADVPARAAPPPGYDRAGAVAYADRYCGAAPGCGNGGRYNPQFFDYNGDGGDCTNFVSQALSLGGRLRQTSEWTFDRRTGEGTAAWVKSGQLVGFLRGTDRASLLARGTYMEVAGDVAELRPGDVIAYFEKGEVQHLALVVGRDSRGYVLVDSHTADRHHVPWDIGWDRKTVYILLQMHYRPGAAAFVPQLVPQIGPVARAGCASPLPLGV